MDGFIRRRDMMKIVGTSPTPTKIYTLESSTTTQNYDTGLKLFETPMRFTILCDAQWNHYGWSGRRSIFGIGSGSDTFRYGFCGSGDDYEYGEVFATSVKRFSSIVVYDDSKIKQSSLYARGNNVSVRRKFAVRYDPYSLKADATNTTRSFEYCTIPLTAVISSSLTMKLLINSATGTVYQFEVYDGLLSQATVDAWIAS